ncbi:MAG: YlxM family DNA-binding protein [Clostridiales bacterium]|nr:YlxM family DNA-binding protein [Clostridiales bacterium]
MKDKNSAFRMTMLYDFYGELLTDRQREFYDLYHNEDFSLAEIAENAGITRQGVRDVIVRAEAILNEMEEKTGIVARFLETREALNAICDCARQIETMNRAQFRSQELARLAREIQDRAAEMQK